MERRVLLRTALGLGLTAAAAAACRQVPLQQELAGEFTGRGTGSVRADQIRRAGASQGWVIETRAPGLMRGTLNRREQQAVVDIPYDSRRFSIRYAGSANLNYDGTSINSNYNSYVQRLHRAIVAQPSI
jgi:hypothetical protein